MKLSAPIFLLKRNAKALSREQQIPLNEALNQVAYGEGFTTWSLLAARYSALEKAGRIYSQLKPGTLMLIGARPGQGKTLLSLQLAIESMKTGNPSYFFSLEFTEQQCLKLFRDVSHDPSEFKGLFTFDGSDAICADYIVKKLASTPRGTLVVVDYLQLLDQKRNTPELSAQVHQLHAFAQQRGLTMIFISQIDRSYDPSTKPFPDMEDIRLPNPLDLKLFDRSCFLHDGEIKLLNHPAGSKSGGT